MQSVISQVEQLQTLAPSVVTGLANKAGDVLADKRGASLNAPGSVQTNMSDGRTYVYRMIQNVSGGNAVVNVAISITADGDKNVHKQLQAGQDMNITSLERVSCWSNAAWAVATIEQVRQS